ncbi:MAG: hypothetical protein IJN66_08485 [Muribaculaceae bacterium]|nr:hypothetical protein [Muribaculaceae bacterium]
MMRGKTKRFSRVYAWAAIPTSASNGFLRPSIIDVAMQCHASRFNK